MGWLFVFALVLVVLGGVFSVAVILRAGRAASDAGEAPVGDGRAVLRVHAEVHTGWEQTLIGLRRELHLPEAVAELPYGALYAEPRTQNRQIIRTRSEIGRGFAAVIDITPHQGLTAVDYAILRLPGDERVRPVVLRFELDLIAAVRKVDATAVVQITGDRLHPFDPSPTTD